MKRTLTVLFAALALGCQTPTERRDTCAESCEAMGAVATGIARCGGGNGTGWSCVCTYPETER